MKKSKMLGVTLLEISLVLAIAALIIVLSIRYYQQSNDAESANAALTQITSIASAADSVSNVAGSYVTGLGATAAAAGTTLNSLLSWPGGSASATIGNSPWGSAITVAAVPTQNTYQISFAATPTSICNLLKVRITTNAHFTTAATCAANAAFTYTYTSNP